MASRKGIAKDGNNGASGSGENTVLRTENRTSEPENLQPQPENRRKNRKKPEKSSARLLSKIDWLLIRHAVIVEGMTFTQAGRQFNMHGPTIRARAQRERWDDVDQIRLMPTTEEIIIMRNQREIMRTLRAMDEKFEAAVQSGDPKKIRAAASSADLVGKRARATQSLARASEVNAASKRMVKAHDKPKSKPQADREALARQLTEIDAKVERAKLPEQSDHG